MKIEKASETGFCSGVKRAVDILENVARERGGVETLGAVVHNQQVMERLAGMGVRVVRNVSEVRGNALVISAHGVSPEIEAQIKTRNIEIINTTCPIVHRAQLTARRLAEEGFFVVVYGEAEHVEVKGVLGWADNKGIATLDVNKVAGLGSLPRRIGVLAQTTQVPRDFTDFTKKLIDAAFTRDSEMQIIDTICYDVRKRQASALELASRADLILVVGGRNSANTNRLAEMCAEVTDTRLIEKAEEIQSSWLKGRKCIGVTGGTSTAEASINEVISRLKEMT